jgi:iron complex outermembrane receptor protein
MRLCVLLIVVSTTAFCQVSADSVVLDEVTIYGLPEEKFLAGSRMTAIDSGLMAQFRGAHLADLLSYQLLVYFRNYGNGMLSGISMRGTAPQHTAVFWNGININSFSLGQADFSILPAIGFDEIQVHEGGGSARFGSGALGGSVLLNSSVIQPEGLYVRQEVGSFGSTFSSIKNQINVRRLIVATTLYNHQSENDFEILQTGDRQRNAEYLQRGILQQVYFKFSENRDISVHYWLHDADRQIQPPIGNSISSDEQQDRNHRLQITYRQNTRFGATKATAGLVSDEIVFNNQPAKVSRWICSLNHQYLWKNRWMLQTQLEWNHIATRIPQYGSDRTENRLDALFAIQRTFQRAAFAFNVRKPVVEGISTPILPYLGFDYDVVKSQKNIVTISANASMNFRVPTLNDRYWQNAGRIDLLPEKSKALEASVAWKNQIVACRTVYFDQWVDNWILWLPDVQGRFKPDNIQKVNARGFEVNVESFLKTGRLKNSIHCAYQHTQSVVKETQAIDQTSIGKQLIYTPVHTATASITSSIDNVSITLLNQFAGVRFTDTSNAEIYQLDPYFLCDAVLSYWLTVKKHRMILQGSFRNIFNVEYMQYASRAMPGRNVNFSLNYQLNYHPK